MWRKAAYLKGRNHSEKSGYSALSSVLSLFYLAQIMDYFLQCPQLDQQSHSTPCQSWKTYMAASKWFKGREISCLASLVGASIPRNMSTYASINKRSTTFTQPLLTLRSYFPKVFTVTSLEVSNLHQNQQPGLG